MRKIPLLILPGWNSNSTRWQKVKKLLEEKGMEVIIFDLPGFGYALTPKKPWGRDDYIKWILQRIKERNLEKFNLLGHSFGGGLAAKIAAENPEIINKLVLCAPAVIQRRCIKVYLFYWIAYLGKKILSLPGLRTFYHPAQKLIYKVAGVRDYHIAKGVMKETMKKLGREGGLETVLEKIKAPTLILWGEKDDILPLKDAYQIKKGIKNSQVKILPRTRHSPHRESPEELAKAVFEFLESP